MPANNPCSHRHHQINSVGKTRRRDGTCGGGDGDGGERAPNTFVYMYEIVKVFFKTNNNPPEGTEVRREHGRTREATGVGVAKGGAGGRGKTGRRSRENKLTSTVAERHLMPCVLIIF